jgi:hypothetical protein
MRFAAGIILSCSECFATVLIIALLYLIVHQLALDTTRRTTTECDIANSISGARLPFASNRMTNVVVKYEEGRRPGSTGSRSDTAALQSGKANRVGPPMPFTLIYP